MLKWINKKRNKKGFTLVELVVVIAILGILAAIAIPKLGGSRDTAKRATHDANARVLKSAASMYIADNPTVTTKEDLLVNNVGDLKNYLDGEDAPKTYGGNNFKVTIVGGNIIVDPDEKITRNKIYE